jgi:hypothetical protein
LAVRRSQAALCFLRAGINKKSPQPPTSGSQKYDSDFDKQLWAYNCRQSQMEHSNALRRCGYARMADKLQRCVVKGKKADNLDNIRFQAALTRCSTRYCYFCGPRLSRKDVRKKLKKLRKHIIDGCNITGITLTLPSISDLEREHIAALFQYFKVFIYGPLLRKIVVGVVAKADLEYNPERLTYNLHLHAVLIHKDRIPRKQKLSDEWFKASISGLNWTELSDVPEYQGRVIDVDPLVNSKHSNLNTAKKIEEAVGYVCKPIRISTSEAFVKYYEVTSNQALIRQYGVMHGNSNKRAKHILDIGGIELPEEDHQSNREIEKIKHKEQTRPTKDQTDQIQLLRLHTTPEQIKFDSIVEDLSHLKYEERERREVEVKQLLEGNKKIFWQQFQNEMAKEKEVRARRTMGMRSTVECPYCSAIMPPHKNLCERCEELEKEVSNKHSAKKAAAAKVRGEGLCRQ